MDETGEGGQRAGKGKGTAILRQAASLIFPPTKRWQLISVRDYLNAEGMMIIIIQDKKVGRNGSEETSLAVHGRKEMVNFKL